MLASLPSQPTPFIGREPELSRLLTLLEQSDCHLITILGAGGVGKTRLAFAAAEISLQRSILPVFNVTLDAPHSREQLSAAIANAVGCSFYGDADVETQLLTWMKDKRFLLLLDNFEHTQQGAAYMMKLLSAVSEIRFLVTSRERLGLRGETAFTLKGFNSAVWESVEEASVSPAVRLFLNTAQRARADFELTDANLTHVSSICRIVEGLPLAIELAAVWVDTLSVKEIADEIEASYTFLSSDFQDLPERHRSMVATFEASWHRLPLDIQDSLMRMSVFRGGFTRAAALAITGASIHTLQTLVNKSLVKYVEDEHYTTHELLRQFLGDKLEEAGQTGSVEAAHSRYFLDWLHSVEPLIQGLEQRDTLDRIGRDFANVRFAWENALKREDNVALDGALDSLFWFCMMRTHYHYGEQLIDRIQMLSTKSGSVRLLHARAQLRRYWIERWRRGLFSEPESIIPQLEAMLNLFQNAPRGRDTAVCLLVLGDASRYTGDHPEEARQYLSRSLELFRGLGDDFYAAWALHFLGRHALMTEGLPRAIQFQQESLALRERCGDLNGVLYAQFNLGDYFLQMGELERSTRLFQRMLERSRETGERSGELMALALLGIIAFLRGDLSSAAKLSEQVFTAATNLNHPLGRTYAVLVECLNAIVRGEPDRAAGSLRTLEPARLHEVVRYWVNLALAMAHVSSEERTAVRECIHEALSYASTIQGTGVMAWCLPVSAVAAAQSGDLFRAASLIALSDKIDLAPWSDSWSIYTELRATLEGKLGAAYSHASEVGEKLDLAATIQAPLQATGAILAGNSPFSPLVVSANQALQEPLSDRELEVLAWIARGLQNAEIADRLVVEMSTIKKHVSHVYGKLGVTTRAQAILKAQELGLV